MHRNLQVEKREHSNKMIGDIKKYKIAIGRIFFFLSLLSIVSLNNSCRSKKGCPGVHYYTTPQVFKDKKMGLVNKTPKYSSAGSMRDSKIINKNGTGAWSKKNKNKDKQKAKSGIIPPHLKKPPKNKSKVKKSQKDVKPKS